jgi:hypothetical protein
MLKIISLILFTFIFGSCGVQLLDEKLEIKIDINYPRWLKSGDYFTEQTSGITFLGRDDMGAAFFLLADDVGNIHQLKIEYDTIFSFQNVNFSEEVRNFLNTLPKKDFEEIVYDRHTGTVYLSIEGNYPDAKNSIGIFELIFKDGNIFSNELIEMKKLDIKPLSLFLEHIENNIGYEGLAVDSKYLYLGLEGIQNEGIFADSTFILVVDKQNLQIIKKISTAGLEITTICGLFSDKERTLYGVDRNSKRLFNLTFDENLNVTSNRVTNFETRIPGYPAFDYVSALEAITMDDEKNIYVVDDPWKKHFVPNKKILEQLDPGTIENYKEFIPIIFKYKLN